MAKLVGMKAICNYVSRSEATVLGWIRDRDFPGHKLGGIWESDSDLIDQWRKRQLFGEAGITAKSRDKKKKIETLV